MTWMQLAFAQFLEDFCGITGTFYFFNSYGGVGLSAFSTPDTNGPIVSVEMIDEYRSFRWNEEWQWKPKYSAKLTQLVICPQ